MAHVHTPTGADVYLTPTGMPRICFSYRGDEPTEEQNVRWTRFNSQLFALGLEPSSDEPDCTLMEETAAGLVIHDHYTLQRVPESIAVGEDCVCEVLPFPSASEESS